MDEKTKIFSLVTVAEEQQKAVASAIDRLDIERAGLAKVSKEIRDAGTAASAAAATVGTAVGALERQVTKAVQESARQAFSGSHAVVASAATTALTEAAQPVTDELRKAVEAATEAAQALQKAGAKAEWRAIIYGLSAGAVVAFLAFGAAEAMKWKAGRDVAELETRAEQLRSEIRDAGNALADAEKHTNGIKLVRDANGQLWLVAPRGMEPQQCRGGPCAKLY